MPRRPPTLRALGAGALLVAAGGLLAGPLAAEAPAPPPATASGEPGHDPFSVLGETRMTAEALVAAYRASGHHERLTVPLEDLARMFVEEGTAYGVRGDIAFAQSLVETGWLYFPDYGQVSWTDNNFAGIGAYDGGAHGFAYPDARTGVRAQMQLLRQYADPAELPDAIVHTPHGGRAPSWLDMGRGNWATSPIYSSTVLKVYGRLLRESSTGFALVPPAPPAPVRPGDGLWLAGADGHVYDVGDARFWGSAGGRVTAGDVAAVMAASGAAGYWTVTGSGEVRAYGDAPSLGGAALPSPVVAAAATPSGGGYWLLGAAGEVAAFGDAPAVTPAPDALPPGVRFVALVPTPTGQGYWLADSAGHVVSVGDAPHLGDLTGREVPAADPVVGMASTPWGDGYWLATAGGEVSAFGAARPHGTLAEALDYESGTPPRVVVAVAATQTGDGYWLVTADGRVEGFGDAYDFGDRELLGAPVTAAAARHDTAAPQRTAAPAEEPDPAEYWPERAQPLLGDESWASLLGVEAAPAQPEQP